MKYIIGIIIFCISFPVFGMTNAKNKVVQYNFHTYAPASLEAKDINDFLFCIDIATSSYLNKDICEDSMPRDNKVMLLNGWQVLEIKKTCNSETGYCISTVYNRELNKTLYIDSNMLFEK